MLTKALLLATCVLTSPACAMQTPDYVELVFLDVGQGDAIVIRSPEGKVALVDAGPNPNITSLRQGEHGFLGIAGSC